MDGVLVDFVSAAMDVHGETYVPSEWPAGVWDVVKVLNARDHISLTTRQFWKNIDETYGFWRKLRPLSTANELLNVVAATNLPWSISTSPSRHPNSSSGKVEWLQQFFGDGFRDYMLGPNKHLLANPETVLIDDGTHNVNAFREAGGHAILFPQPWNENHAITNKVEHVRRELTALTT